MEEKIINLLKSINQDVTSIVINSIERIGNNKAAIVYTNNSTFFAKHYFESINDNRDRFQTEVSFFEYTKLCAPDYIPKIYAIDKINRIIIFENILGNNLNSDNLNSKLILSAASFFSLLNKPEIKYNYGGALKNASEACFTIRDHLNLIEKRIVNLEKIKKEEHEDVELFKTITLIRDLYENITDQIITFSNFHNIDLNKELDTTERVLSPSDFGFHNCIKMSNGKLVFFDFEYSGWDDPAKVTGDFFGQLQVPVSENYFNTFVERAFDNLKEKNETIIRCKLLLPLYKIKWACIAMNVFIPINLERRLFSNPDLDINSYKSGQIKKAQNILFNIQKNKNVLH